MPSIMQAETFFSSRRRLTCLVICFGLAVSVMPFDATAQFLYSPIEFTKSNSVPQETSTAAKDINNSGIVIGTFGPDPLPESGSFIFQNGHYTTLQVPGAVDTLANGINNLSTIVGSYMDG